MDDQINQSIRDRRDLADAALKIGLLKTASMARTRLEIEQTWARSPEALQVYWEINMLLQRAIAILPPEKPQDWMS